MGSGAGAISEGKLREQREYPPSRSDRPEPQPQPPHANGHPATCDAGQSASTGGGSGDGANGAGANGADADATAAAAAAAASALAGLSLDSQAGAAGPEASPPSAPLQGSAPGPVTPAQPPPPRPPAPYTPLARPPAGADADAPSGPVAGQVSAHAGAVVQPLVPLVAALQQPDQPQRPLVLPSQVPAAAASHLQASAGAPYGFGYGVYSGYAPQGYAPQGLGHVGFGQEALGCAPTQWPIPPFAPRQLPQGFVQQQLPPLAPPGFEQQRLQQQLPRQQPAPQQQQQQQRLQVGGGSGRSAQAQAQTTLRTSLSAAFARQPELFRDAFGFSLAWWAKKRGKQLGEDDLLCMYPWRDHVAVLVRTDAGAAPALHTRGDGSRGRRRRRLLLNVPMAGLLRRPVYGNALVLRLRLEFADQAEAANGGDDAAASDAGSGVGGGDAPAGGVDRLCFAPLSAAALRSCMLETESLAEQVGRSRRVAKGHHSGRLWGGAEGKLTAGRGDLLSALRVSPDSQLGWLARLPRTPLDETGDPDVAAALALATEAAGLPTADAGARRGA
ncbi:hypothetical protein GPECTOR_22g874 [Gonium pectorale]|uniref:Uncharacterized protein n=1 Tax=Gonium pectorale TaxID=33097 RepID=A0A150GIQ7_GONPE|nr:hypothetical protein GPECTOR_22g874 [Gonium pectorale]|eukprot:KXZ49280.1 hypothetical protein GPECTOR_22g874 [Gonium pectorale]